MKKTIVALLAAALFAPVAALAFALPSEGCGHYITDLATGSGGYEGMGCDEQTLATLGANANLKIVERVDALKTLVSMLTARILQLSTSQSSSACFVPVNDLYMGRTDAQTGGEVSKLQLWLKAEGFFPDAQGTGYYGNKTADAVMRWQKAHGMDFVTLTSGVGKQTRAKMKELCAMTSGEVVSGIIKWADGPGWFDLAVYTDPILNQGGVVKSYRFLEETAAIWSSVFNNAMAKGDSCTMESPVTLEIANSNLVHSPVAGSKSASHPYIYNATFVRLVSKGKIYDVCTVPSPGGGYTTERTERN